MVSIEKVRQFALSFEGSEEKPHFEKASFRVKGKIFATLDTQNDRACLMLTPIDQSVFSKFDPAIIYPVPNAWGKQGATFVELKKVPVGIFKDALKCAYRGKAPKDLAKKYKDSE